MNTRQRTESVRRRNAYRKRTRSAHARKTDRRDRDVVARAIAGNETAVAALYCEYLKRLESIAHHHSGGLRTCMDAQDFVQDTWVDALRSLSRFEDRGEGSFFRWLRTCLTHRVDAERRKAATQKRSLHRQVSLPPNDRLNFDDHLPPSALAEIAEEANRIVTWIDRLPTPTREILHLRIEDDLTFGEIGLRVGKSAEATKKRYRRSLAGLRDRANRPSDN